MIFKDIATQKNDSQKLADISLAKGKPNALWNELSETSEAAVSGGSWNSPLTIRNSEFITNKGIRSIIRAEYPLKNDFASFEVHR